MKTTRHIFIALLAIAFVVASCFGVIYLSAFAVGYLIRGTRPLPGDAAQFDVIATYPDIRKFAGDDVQLLWLNMRFVKSDGTLDLTANYEASVNYRFARLLDSAPENAAPLGAGGKPDGKYAQQVNVVAERPGMDGGTRENYYNFGMRRSEIPAAPLEETIAETPICTPKQLWDVALKNDAPANAVATIRYDSDGYQFSISDTSIYLRFDTACNLIK